MKKYKALKIALVIIISLSTILALLGYKTRIGYIKISNLNIEETLKNNLIPYSIIDDSYYKIYNENNSIEISKINIEEYLKNSNIISNFVFNFKIEYYDKIFRSSDIYNVYIDSNKIINKNPFIRKIDGGGGIQIWSINFN